MHRHTEQANENKSGLLGYLFILTGFFILLQISLFIQGSDIYLGDYKLVADHLKIPATVLPGVLYFLSVQLSLHVLFALAVWSVASGVGKVFQFSVNTTVKLGLAFWVLAVVTVLLANQHFFPNSRFSRMTEFVLPDKLAFFLLVVFFIVLCFATLIALYAISIKKSLLTFILIGSTAGFILLKHFWPVPVVLDASTQDKPNIIIIGIDSLRPDFLGFFGAEQQTPHLDQFLTDATVFSDAMTPLARTFPAWVSILTGEYPKHTGIRFNLPMVDQASWENTLPEILQKQGYRTIFATDETRFSNIDESFGFDKTLTPPIGFNDFLLGNLNDFPIANLLVNTPLGEYLFPHSFGNRPVFNTYSPNSFLRFLTPELMTSRTKPLFFAVHFCLPHYPYLWGSHPADDKAINNYRFAVNRVDRQFNDFLALLKRGNLLNHAIIILLSDHGEAIELDGDRVTDKDLFIAGLDNKKHLIPHFYPKSFDTESVNQSAGHGTDVLGLTQYHIVFAMKTIGLQKNLPTVVTERVSLLDIKPTLLDFLHIKKRPEEDGVSLKETILKQGSLAPEAQHFFFESDFSPQAVRSIHPETRKLLFQGIDYFQIDPVTARINVKKNMVKMIISSKQFADLYGDWVLALYPQDKTEMMPILVNLDSGEWTNDLRTPFATKSPATKMLAALKKFYHDDVTRVENSPS